jgi:hypothetical protein
MVRQVTIKGKQPGWIEVAFVATGPICIDMVADSRMSALDAVERSSTGIQVPDRACYSVTAHVAYWHFAGHCQTNLTEPA